MKSSPPQEPDRISLRRIAWIGVLSILVGVVGVAASRVLDLPKPRRSPTNAPATIGMLEQGSIESSERGVTLRKEQEASLHAYAWRDQDAGIAEIPIERAMQIVEERSR